MTQLAYNVSSSCSYASIARCWRCAVKKQDPPLRLKISCEYLPDKASARGISPSSSMICAA